MAEALLTLEHIAKRFQNTDVLRGISLTVQSGEFITLLGPSGCGKTTTLRVVAGLLSPDSGRVLLNGKDITAWPPEKRPLNTVFQNYALFPHMNVEKNIAYGLTIRGVPRAERARRVGKMLALVRLEGMGKRMPSELSGGQKQRVAIARAVILQPKLLLLDEPLGALDLSLRRQMQTELKGIQKTLGIAFLYITHDQEEALNMSDRIAVMNAGVLEQVGAPEDIYERPTTRFVAAFIGQGELFDAVCAADGRFLTDAGACPGDAYAAAGERVTVSVHAERIRYSPAPAPGFDMPAVIETHRYAGDKIVTGLTLEKTGRAISVSASESIARLPAPGTRVYVYWDAGHARVIREAGV